MTWEEFKQKLNNCFDLTEIDLDLIQKAFNFAYQAHSGQKRKSGEDYFNHCVRTALNLASLKTDAQIISAGLLHDVLEDTPTKEEDLQKNFGEEITQLVKNVTKIGHYRYLNQDQEQAMNLVNLILAISQDLRVAIIKLADRLDNMRTLEFLPPEKIKKIALETRDIFVPLALKLGIHIWASELDELSFKFLEPEKYEWVKSIFLPKIEKGKKYLNEIIKITEESLRKNKIKIYEINYRIKTFSSIYKKLIKKNFDPELIFDLFGIRVIVDKVEECYLSLGVIHALFYPLESEFDDYISKPKPNGYRSLHTVVLTPYEFFVEFQIRTLEMHHFNEFGTASYFSYSQSKTTKIYQKNLSVFTSLEDKKFLEEIKKVKETSKLSSDLIKSLKLEFIQEKIYVLTPKGKIIELVKGATPIDFAYKIHTEIGNHAAGARVNGKIVPLNYELSNGDIVEIITNKNKTPSVDWLNFVKTKEARKKIKSFLRKKIQISKPLEFLILIKTKNDPILFQNVLDFLKEKNVEIIDSKNTNKEGLQIIKIKVRLMDKKEKEFIAFNLKNKFKEILEIKVDVV